MANDSNEKTVFEIAEEEVQAELMEADKAKYKAQLRSVASARQVLANEERKLEVLRRSILEG